MLLVESIDKVVAWLNENVCNQIQLKLPDDGEVERVPPAFHIAGVCFGSFPRHAVVGKAADLRGVQLRMKHFGPMHAGVPAGEAEPEFVEDGNIWDYYPYWHNWISFTLEAGVSATTPKQYEDLL